MAIPVLAIASAVLPELAKILDRVIPDPEAKAKALGEMADKLLSADARQLEVNKIEAAHPSIFVAGWRPFIGWVCGAGLAYALFIQPILGWASTIWFPGVPLPNINDNLWELAAIMLGMAGWRSLDKIKGKA